MDAKIKIHGCIIVEEPSQRDRCLLSCEQENISIQFSLIACLEQIKSEISQMWSDLAWAGRRFCMLTLFKNIVV